MSKSLDYFQMYLSNIKFKSTVIGLTKTLDKENISELYVIEDYNIENIFQHSSIRWWSVSYFLLKFVTYTVIPPKIL